MIAKYFFVLACLCNGFKLKYRQLTGVELIHKSILLHSSGYQSYDVSVKETNLLKFCKSYCQIILPDFFSNENPIIFYLSIDGVNFSRMKLIGVTITDYSDTEEYEDIARKNSNVEAAMYIYDNFGLSGIVAATSENANALHSKRVEIERYILTQAAYRLIFGSKNTSANSDYSRTTNSGSSSLREQGIGTYTPWTYRRPPWSYIIHYLGKGLEELQSRFVEDEIGHESVNNIKIQLRHLYDLLDSKQWPFPSRVSGRIGEERTNHPPSHSSYSPVAPRISSSSDRSLRQREEMRKAAEQSAEGSLNLQWEDNNRVLIALLHNMYDLRHGHDVDLDKHQDTSHKSVSSVSFAVYASAHPIPYETFLDMVSTQSTSQPSLSDVVYRQIYSSDRRKSVFPSSFSSREAYLYDDLSGYTLHPIRSPARKGDVFGVLVEHVGEGAKEGLGEERRRSGWRVEWDVLAALFKAGGFDIRVVGLGRGTRDGPGRVDPREAGGEAGGAGGSPWEQAVTEGSTSEESNTGHSTKEVATLKLYDSWQRGHGRGQDRPLEVHDIQWRSSAMSSIRTTRTMVKMLTSRVSASTHRDSVQATIANCLQLLERLRVYVLSISTSSPTPSGFSSNALGENFHLNRMLETKRNRVNSNQIVTKSPPSDLKSGLASFHVPDTETSRAMQWSGVTAQENRHPSASSLSTPLSLSEPQKELVQQRNSTALAPSLQEALSPPPKPSAENTIKGKINLSPLLNEEDSSSPPLTLSAYDTQGSDWRAVPRGTRRAFPSFFSSIRPSSLLSAPLSSPPTSNTEDSNRSDLPVVYNSQLTVHDVVYHVSTVDSTDRDERDDVALDRTSQAGTIRTKADSSSENLSLDQPLLSLSMSQSQSSILSDISVIQLKDLAKVPYRMWLPSKTEVNISFKDLDADSDTSESRKDKETRKDCLPIDSPITNLEGDDESMKNSSEIIKEG